MRAMAQNAPYELLSHSQKIRQAAHGQVPSTLRRALVGVTTHDVSIASARRGAERGPARGE